MTFVQLLVVLQSKGNTNEEFTPEVIDLHGWEEMCTSWATKQFEKRSSQRKTNRNKERREKALGTFTRGSISTEQHAKRMVWNFYSFIAF